MRCLVEIAFAIDLFVLLITVTSIRNVKSEQEFRDCHLEDYKTGSKRCGSCSNPSTQPCFRKCCALGEIYLNSTCIKSEFIQIGSFIRNLYTVVNTTNSYATPTIIHGIPCFGPNSAFPVDTPYELFPNGTFLMKPNDVLNLNDYCGDVMEVGTDKISFIYCFKRHEKTLEYGGYFQVLLFLSVVFLILTLSVYLLVEGVGEKLAGKISISHMASLLLSFSLLLDIRLSFLSGSFSNTCFILGYAVHYFLLANFFWLNVMCFDIWLVFSGRTTPYRNLSKDQERRKFLKYSLYAWGVPALICFLTFVLDKTLSSDVAIKPNVGKETCLMSQTAKALFYFFPLSILLILNISMFLATAFKIYQHEKEIKVLRSGESNVNNPLEKERLHLYVKLFLIMGVTWITEPLSWYYCEPELLWIITDSINALLGIPIFLIFVCKVRTLRAINTRFCPSVDFFCWLPAERKQSTAFNTTTTSTISSTNARMSIASQIAPKNPTQKTAALPSQDLEMKKI